MRLDYVMVEKGITSVELAKKIGISPVNLSRIKTGKIRGVRFGPGGGHARRGRRTLRVPSPPRLPMRPRQPQ